MDGVIGCFHTAICHVEVGGMLGEMYNNNSLMGWLVVVFNPQWSNG